MGWMVGATGLAPALGQSNTPIHFSMRDSTGSALNRLITITPLDGVRGFYGTNLVPPTEITVQPSGGIADTNLCIGNYRITFQGLASSMQIFWYGDSCPSITNAADSRVQRTGLVGVYAFTNPVPGDLGYSNAATFLLSSTNGGSNHLSGSLEIDGTLTASNTSTFAGVVNLHGPLLIDGAGTNGNVTTSPFVTLSSRGILNGLSSRTNDGSNFGPDTPGTTTMGIQEALNAIVVRSQNQSGLWVQMMGGNYYYTNRIVWTNHAGSLYRLDGPSDANTALIYAGPAVTNVSLFTINAIGTLVDPSVVQLNHITFGSLTNIPATLLTITNTSDEMLNRVSFLGKWQGQVTPFVALVGLDIGTRSANVSVIENSFFSQLATGLKNDSDHLHVIRTTFDHNGQVPGTLKNAWTNLASPYAIGAAVFVPPYLPREDNRYIGCHFYSDYVGVAFDSAGITPPGAGGNVQIFEDCVFADTPYQVACNDVANGVAPFQWFGHTVSDNTNASPQGDFSGIEGEDVWDAVFAGPTSAFRGLIFNHGGNYDTNGLPNGAVTNFFPGFTRNTMEQQLGDSPNHYFNAPVIGASGFYGDFSGATNANASTLFSSGTLPMARLSTSVLTNANTTQTSTNQILTTPQLFTPLINTPTISGAATLSSGFISTGTSNFIQGQLSIANQIIATNSQKTIFGTTTATNASIDGATGNIVGTHVGNGASLTNIPGSALQIPPLTNGQSTATTFSNNVTVDAAHTFIGSHTGNGGALTNLATSRIVAGAGVTASTNNAGQTTETLTLSSVGSFIPLWASVSVSPSAATTYYVGADMVTGMGTTYSNAAFTITKACTLKGYAVKVRCTAGTSEQVAHAIFINNATVVGTISNAWNVASVDVYTNGLSQALAAGDTLVLRVQSPATWATPAVSSRTMVTVYVE